MGGGGSRKPYVILMGGHAKCLLLITRGEGGGSKIQKTCLRNTWMFPKHKGLAYKVHTRLFRKKGKGPKRFDKCCFEEFYIKISHLNII